ncbi:MAG: HAMP domain-containing sensor histidine kinase [Gemmatimonadales bacterium]
MMTPATPRRARQRYSRAELLLAAAFATVLLLVGLGSWTLWSTMVRHRASADETLMDHASYIALSYANSTQSETWFAVRTMLATAKDFTATDAQVISADSLAARSAQDALGPGMVPVAPRLFFAGDSGHWRSLSAGVAIDSALTNRLELRLRDSIPRTGNFVGAVMIRGADTSLIFFEPIELKGEWVGMEVPLPDFREKILMPPLDRLVMSFRYLEDSLHPGSVRDTVAQPLSVEVATHGGTILMRHGPQTGTPWHGLRMILGTVGAHVTLWIEPPGVPVLMPGGYPPKPGPRVLAGIIIALLLVGGAAYLAWRTVALSRQREEFTSSVSHELRTPLTNIQLFAETLLMERARTPEERRTALETITRETRRLVHMVENVLAFSRVGRPSETLVRRSERVNRLVEDAVHSFGPLFRAHGITPAVTVTGPSHASVDGDAVRRILVNLLDNAVRYGPDGQAIIVNATHDGVALNLTVEDEGPGVPIIDRERIWQPFERGSLGADGGTGIGLAVVHQLVALHGGSVQVEDGRCGARFRVRLPLESGEAV